MQSTFPLSRCQRNFILLFLRHKTLCKTWQNTRKFNLYCWDHVCKVNEWCLMNCFHCKFSISTQIMVRDYGNAECKKLSMWLAFNSLLAIFFTIQTIYANLNPEDSGPVDDYCFHWWLSSQMNFLTFLSKVIIVITTNVPHCWLYTYTHVYSCQVLVAFFIFKFTKLWKMLLLIENVCIQ